MFPVGTLQGREDIPEEVRLVKHPRKEGEDVITRGEWSPSSLGNRVTTQYINIDQNAK
jgi:hypothetical protein